MSRPFGVDEPDWDGFQKLRLCCAERSGQRSRRVDAGDDEVGIFRRDLCSFRERFFECIIADIADCSDNGLRCYPEFSGEWRRRRFYCGCPFFRSGDTKQDLNLVATVVEAEPAGLYLDITQFVERNTLSDIAANDSVGARPSATFSATVRFSNREKC